jgi:hypothetical protein
LTQATADGGCAAEEVDQSLKNFDLPSSVIRPVGAVVADMHDEWQSGERHYLSEGSMVRLKPASDAGGIVARRPETMEF